MSFGSLRETTLKEGFYDIDAPFYVCYNLVNN